MSQLNLHFLLMTWVSESNEQTMVTLSHMCPCSVSDAADVAKDPPMDIPHSAVFSVLKCKCSAHSVRTL